MSILSDVLSSFFSDQDLKSKQKLSLQFLLSEILSSFSIIESCKETSDASELREKLDGLISFSTDNFLAPRIGNLDKILYYIEILWEGVGSLDSLSFYISLKNLKKKLIVKKNVLLSVERKQLNYDQKDLVSRLKSIFDLATTLFTEILENLVFFFHEFKEDENVLFCLYKYKERLTAILPSFHSFIKNLHPEDANKMQKIILKNYNERGFGPVITQHLLDHE